MILQMLHMMSKVSRPNRFSLFVSVVFPSWFQTTPTSVLVESINYAVTWCKLN